MFIRQVPILAALALLALSAWSCGSSPTRADEGVRSDVSDEGPRPGELEETVRQYLLDMTELLRRPVEDPHQTVSAIGGYLDSRQDQIRQSVRELHQRIAQMSDQDRVYYEEQFSAFFESATLEWHAALDQFRQEHPDQASLIDGLMLYFD